MTKTLSRGLTLGLALFLGAPALRAGENLVLRTEVFEDVSGARTFAEVLRFSPTPYTGMLTRGYRSSAFWIRVTLKMPAAAREGVLRVRPQYLDEIALFDPVHPEAPPVLGGDRHAPPPNAPSSLFHTWTVPIPRDGCQYWLRIRGTSAITVDVQALTREDASHVEQDVGFLYALYLGFLAFAIVWAAFMYFAHRDGLVGIFMVQQLCTAVQFLLVFGFVRHSFPGYADSGALDFVTNGFILALTLTGLWFHLALLRLHRASRWGLLLIVFAMACFVPEMALLMKGRVREALHLNMGLATLVGPLLFAVSLSVPRRIHLREHLQCFPRGILIAIYGLFMVLLLLMCLPALGLLRNNEILMHGYVLHNVLIGMIMLGFLQWRTVNIERMRLRRTYKAELLRHQVASQGRRITELRQLMSMLAHEMKNSLSVMSVASSAREFTSEMRRCAQIAVSDMNGIIDRCLKAFQVEEGPTVKIAPCDLLAEIALLRHLDTGKRLRVTADRMDGFRTDAGLFRVLLGNLVENALKYGAPDQPVFLVIRRDARDGQRGVDFRVSNVPGEVGMPDPKRVFEKFYRAPGARRVPGAGLGLFLVHNIVRQLGGSLEYRPEAGMVHFHIWLPE